MMKRRDDDDMASEAINRILEGDVWTRGTAPFSWTGGRPMGWRGLVSNNCRSQGLTSPSEGVVWIARSSHRSPAVDQRRGRSSSTSLNYLVAALADRPPIK